MLSQKLWNVIVERWKECVITSRNPKVPWHKLDSYNAIKRECPGELPGVLFVLGLCDYFCFRLYVVLLRCLYLSIKPLQSVLLWPAPERRTYYITNTYSLWPCFSWKPGTRQRCCNSCEPHSFSGFISLPIDFPKRGPGMLSGNLNLKLRSFSSLGHLLI